MEEKPILERYLCEYFGVQELYQIDPWKFVGPVDCWAPARDVTVRSVHTGPGVSAVQNNKKPRDPFEGREYDYTRANLRSWQCIYAQNPSSEYCCVQSNYVPNVFRAQIENQDRMLEAAGAKKGLVMRLPPKMDGAVNDPIFQSTESNWFLSRGFNRTMACIGPKNIGNGIIKLPPEVCVDLPKQAEVFRPDGIGRTIDVETYYLVPRNHIISWKLQIDEDTCKRQGMFSLNMSCMDENKIAHFLYHVVCDETFMTLMGQCMAHWMNKVQLQPVESLQINMDQAATIRTAVTYTVWPQMTEEMIQSLRPTLHESIRPYYKILEEQMFKKLTSKNVVE